MHWSSFTFSPFTILIMGKEKRKIHGSLHAMLMVNSAKQNAGILSWIELTLRCIPYGKSTPTRHHFLLTLISSGENTCSSPFARRAFMPIAQGGFGHKHCL